MSGTDDPDSKTEAPTEKRRQDARDKGDILRSKDFGTAMALLSLAAYFSFTGADLVQDLASSVHAGLTFTSSDIHFFDAQARMLRLVQPLLLPMACISTLLYLVALGSQSLLGSLRVNFRPLGLDFKRLDPLKGFGRMFGKQGLTELIKALAKVAVVLSGGIYFLSHHDRIMLGLAQATMSQAMADTGSLILALVFLLGGLSLALAGGDIFTTFQRLQSRLRMSRDEIKEEHKQSEGSPEAKHYRRKRQREILKSNFRGALKDANVVVTNPLHFAVALRYAHGKDKAPVVLAKGRDLMAEALREIALEKKIPILPSPALARALYFTGKSGSEIHFELYHAVAAVLAFIFAVDSEMRTAPDVDVPEGFRFDKNGKPLSD